METAKKKYYNESQNKRTQAYIHKNYDQISVRIKKGRRELYKQALTNLGLSLNEYIVQKLEELL